MLNLFPKFSVAIASGTALCAIAPRRRAFYALATTALSTLIEIIYKSTIRDLLSIGLNLSALAFMVKAFLVRAASRFCGFAFSFQYNYAFNEFFKSS